MGDTVVTHSDITGSGLAMTTDECEGDRHGDFDDEVATTELIRERPLDELPHVSRKTRRGRRTRPRGKTIALRQIRTEDRARPAVPYPELDAARPKTRAECGEQARPCPWVSCKHHLYLDINPVTGSIKINFPDLEPWELPHTCALDVAETGGLTLEEVGEITNLTRERIRQVEVRGLLKLKSSPVLR